MGKQPLPLPDAWAGLPDEAGYDTVYAAIMATESGRRFLNEYAARNRHADTQTLVAAIARVEAAIRGEPSVPTAAVAVRDLIAIAAAIEGIEAAMAAGENLAPDVSAAFERIQDIAFVLHERPVEPSLCDALDAAVREISEALVRSDQAAQRVERALELLRGLAGRVRRLIGEQGTRPAAAGSAAEAQASAAAGAAIAQAEPPADVHRIHASAEAAVGPGAAGDAPGSAAMLNQTLIENQFARADVVDQGGGSVDSSGALASSQDARSEGLLPLQDFPAGSVPDPEQDPGDLFEPLPIPSPIAASSVAPSEPKEAADGPADIPPPADAPSHTAAAPQPRPMTPPAAADHPLAAVQALSEEELIALFS